MVLEVCPRYSCFAPVPNKHTTPIACLSFFTPNSIGDVESACNLPVQLKAKMGRDWETTVTRAIWPAPRVRGAASDSCLLRALELARG